MTTDVISQKVARTCDACKARKVRCVGPEDGTQTACRNCTTRNTPCHYSYLKRPRKRKLVYEDASSPAVSISKIAGISSSQLEGTRSSPCQSAPEREPASTLNANHQGHLLVSQLHVDLVLSSRQTPATLKAETSSTKLTEIFGHNSNLSFFSSSRVRSLNIRLGHTKLDQLMQRIDSVLNSKMNKRPSSLTYLYSLRQSKAPSITASLMGSYIKSYFDQVHPIYPFLDRQAFEKKAFELSSQSPTNIHEAWSALYYTVLAIGCQYHEGGNFDPGSGTAWKLFEFAFSYFPDIIMRKGSLLAVQALTAMAIFSTAVPAYQFESLVVTEAAKMCQSMGYNKATSTVPSPNEEVRRRTFWVVYCLEKTACFNTGRASVIMDSDIGCPIPLIPESIFGNYDWFLSFARYSRLLSRIYESLFTVSSGESSAETYHASIKQMNTELEAWRLSIPVQFRPLEQFSGRMLPGTLEICIAVTTQYLYFNALLTLLRIVLYIKAGDMGTAPDMQEAKRQLMKTVCLVLDSTKYIEVAAYTSMWILALMPMSALFILFDLVIHNPTHPETDNNLALLDVASGHFSRIEYATGGTLPGSLVSEFAHIARDFVRDAQRDDPRRNGRINTSKSRMNSRDMTLNLPRQTGAANANTFDVSPGSQLLSISQSNSQGQLVPGTSQTIVHGTKPPDSVSAAISQLQQHHQPSHACVGHSHEHFPASSQPSDPTLLTADNGTEQIFFPLADDPTYAVQRDDGDLQQLLGIDVMDLFDFTAPFTWGG